MENQQEEVKQSVSIYTDHNGVAVLCDKPGHFYHISDSDGKLLDICLFQDGPIKDVGVNGIQNEHLLAILINRLAYLNNVFRCEENEAALQNLKNALDHLEARTRNRMARNVEGSFKA